VSLVCGSRTELGKANPDTAVPAERGGRREGASQAGRTRKGLSTVAGFAGGPVRSSGEAPVMGVERSGADHPWFVRSVNRASPGGAV
jgi:hypothetical protein